MDNFDVIVFTNGPSAYAPKRVIEEVGKKGRKAKVFQYRNLYTSFGKEELLPKTKSVFLRGMGEDVNHLPMKYLLLNHYKNIAKVLNVESFSTWLSLDKVTQHIEYVKNGIPTAKSMYFGNNFVKLEAI